MKNYYYRLISFFDLVVLSRQIKMLYIAREKYISLFDRSIELTRRYKSRNNVLMTIPTLFKSARH